MKINEKDLNNTRHSQESFLKETQAENLTITNKINSSHTNYVKSYNELKEHMNHNNYEIIDETPKYAFVVDWKKE